METNSFTRRKFVAALSAGSITAIINPFSVFGNSIINTNNPASFECNAADMPLRFTDEPEWVEINNIIYGAKPDKQGLIGGGNAYIHLVTKGDYTVTNLDDLLDALLKATAGQVIFIPSETVIDLTTRIYIENIVLEVPEGVTLAGERGYNGSKGALLCSDAIKTPVMIRARGPNVRITGLRIQGPNPKRYLEHHKRSFDAKERGHEYYYKFPVSNGIYTKYSQLEVDNCEVSAFSHSGIQLDKGKDHFVHHNFIHKCQYNGLGYGISHNTASSLIEYNLFDSNRHSIAGTGSPGCSYIARHNIELGISLSHCFDMHGGTDRKDGTEIAGTSIEIYNNTFHPTTRAVVIRGIPEEKCEVHHNWFLKHSDATQAVRASKRTQVFNNVYGEEPKEGR